jgi:hypothetical protein
MTRRGLWPFRPLLLVVLPLAMLAACAPAARLANGPYDMSIAAGLHPLMTADQAVAATWAYLAEQQPELAAPELHADPHVQQVWAVPASDAHALDGCIPSQGSDAIVWVTKGTGDYLNLQDHPWSRQSGQTDDPAAIACQGPGPAGIIVIDDATGQILGVYPLIGPQYPHPSGS